MGLVLSFLEHFFMGLGGTFRNGCLNKAEAFALADFREANERGGFSNGSGLRFIGSAPLDGPAHEIVSWLLHWHLGPTALNWFGRPFINAFNLDPGILPMRLNPEAPTAYWGDATFPISDGTGHFLVAGGPGSGKTITLRLLMQSVLKHLGSGLGQRLLVCDTHGDLYPILAGMDPKCPIHILNPFDQRAAAWDLAADVTTALTANQLAASLIPDPESGQTFFAAAARQIVAAICVSFIRRAPGDWTLRDVLLAARGRNRLRSVLRLSPDTAHLAESLFANEPTADNIFATLGLLLLPFEAVAACSEHTEAKISLTAWLQSEAIILFSTRLSEPDLPPFYQAMFQRLAGLILEQKASASSHTWIFLDQLDEALRFERLEKLLAAGRSKGACVAMSFQDIEKLRRLYGPAAAGSITAACRRKTFLRTHSKETAEWASCLAGSAVTTDGICTPRILPEALMSLPMPGPASGFPAFHQSPDGGITFSRKSWDWILANLKLPNPAELAEVSRPASDRILLDWTYQDYCRLRLQPPENLSPVP